jgi:hypothetical protein
VLWRIDYLIDDRVDRRFLGGFVDAASRVDDPASDRADFSSASNVVPDRHRRPVILEQPEKLYGLRRGLSVVDAARRVLLCDSF